MVPSPTEDVTRAVRVCFEDDLFVFRFASLRFVSNDILIDYFTVVCSETWTWDGGEAGVDLVLIQISLLLLCKTSCSYAN